MIDAVVTPPTPVNEPVLSYAPGTPARTELRAELDRQRADQVDIPAIIGGEEVRTGQRRPCVMPHAKDHVLGHYHTVGASEIERAIAAAVDAGKQWSRMPWQARAAVFLRAADLLTGKYRAAVNAATMLNQSKTPHQAEIDAACELADFWRFNCAYARELYGEQPPVNPAQTWNTLDLRPLEGFVLAITPFNFTSIGGNLPTAPAIMGNAALWKPAGNAMAAPHVIMQVLAEAGLPPGVINLVPGSGSQVAKIALASPELAGIHFTGSTAVFRSLWRGVADNLDRYRSYPRLVGETGGKDFIVAHPSADPAALVTAIVRGGFEYQGQKCSAASRVYVPESLWAKIRDPLVADVDSLRMGDICDFSNFMGAVIDGSAFADHRAAIEEARAATDASIVVGGETDDSVGWFVKPTVIQVTDPKYRTMRDELFGPIVTLFVYPDTAWKETLELVDSTSPYALTGAVFANDRAAVVEAATALRNAAGNFYVNDKPTGAVVGQQPFGGARASGTNDKAGSPANLRRWVSPRAIKENFAPPTSYRYPYMEAE